MRSWSNLAFVSIAIVLPAQELYIRSEFQRVGADGKVIPQDKLERSREILSPALARNGFASYINRDCESLNPTNACVASNVTYFRRPAKTVGVVSLTASF